MSVYGDDEEVLPSGWQRILLAHCLVLIDVEASCPTC